MEKGFLLEIVTPEKQFFSEDVEMVIVRTSTGDMGILKNHEPTVAPLAIGAVKIKKDGVTKYAATSDGFLFVQRDKTLIVTNTAEWSNEIDVARAKRALEEAKASYEKADEAEKYYKKIKLLKAINRINVADSNKK